MNYIELITKNAGEEILANDLAEAATFYEPLVDAMFEEGSYWLKMPCYNESTINPDTPKECMRGSPFVAKAQVIQGGDTSWNKVTVNVFDNNHRVYSVFPHHLPEIQDWKVCPPDPNVPCEIYAWTVSENYYDRISVEDTGFFPNAALETKAKLISTQQIQQHTGRPDANFTLTDGDKTHCKKINQASLDLGLSMVSAEALARYNKLGKKLVMGDDEGPYNAGPLWIWDYMKYTDNEDKTQTLVNAPYMATPTDYWEPQVQGFHYCKVLSPYKVVEWVYVDALYDRDSRAHHSSQRAEDIIQ